MISYRVAETGYPKNGGDGYVFLLHDKLVERGYTVFIGEEGIDAGEDWANAIKKAIVGCEVFVVLCSSTYGETKWTLREFQQADKLNKPIIPIWHSGVFPPDAIEIFLVGCQRIPTGASSQKDVRSMDVNEAVDQLVIALRKKKCFPINCPTAKVTTPT
jgi:hypothetical protein